MLNGKNDSLKQYYVKLQELYSNAVNMLTAINQSLTTAASEVTVNVSDGNNGTSAVKIPSFIYLENKLEQLSSNFNNLFKLPESGEAWFTNENNMFKLNMVKTNVAPITPKFNTSNIFSYTKQNHIFKDLVNPKTYIKLNITNLPNNINSILMKKIIFNDVNLYNSLIEKNVTSYNDFKNAVYNLTNGVEYSEYDAEIKLPIKRDQYNAYFDIIDIPYLVSGNPYNEESTNKLRYRISLNTIKYTDIENDSIVFSLKSGDMLTLINTNTIYKIIKVESNYDIIIEEVIGHSALQTVHQNSESVLTLYNQNYDQFKYVELPLEENPYICVFISTVQNNIRSYYSAPLFINLNNILMKEENGQYIYKDNSNTPMNYMEYYNKYCKNIGDLLLGFIETTYPQLSNYTKSELNILQNSDDIKRIVSETINSETILTVQKINNHLIDDLTSKNIVNLHNEKSKVSSQLNALQSNIDQVYSQLVTTDFSQETTLTQESLRAKLDGYYNQRVTLQKQEISIVNNIDVLKSNAAGLDNAKFRIRGITNSQLIENYVKDNFNIKCDIIGLEVEYKYKSINSDTTNVSVINTSVFTDWNRLINIEKQRKLIFDEYGDYTISYENYDQNNNIIKWNQIDIPINQGEDVVIRIRYKYCIGQPFINLYTPWSDEITMMFPTEFSEISEISTIITKNNDDVINAKFNNTLINEGYQEHITNKIIDNSQIYYHMPENIYSGFNTPENKLISLKDKLLELSNEIEKYKSLIDNQLNAEYKVYIEYDNMSIELSNNTINKISINDYNNDDTFIKKEINLVIKNVGSTQIKLYSIFPGMIDMDLLDVNKQFYNEYKQNYECVPLLYGNNEKLSEQIYTQKLGQWIYFRENNPMSMEEYYTNTYTDNNILGYIKSNKQFKFSANNITNDGLVNKVNDIVDVINGLMCLSNKLDKYNNDTDNNQSIFNDDLSKIDNNNVLLCYENLFGINDKNKVYLSSTTPINDFLNNYAVNGNLNDTNIIIDVKNLYGGFLVPKLLTNTDLLCDKFDNNQYKILDVAKTISIPLIFEYYLNEENNKVEKTLSFDLRTTLLNDPDRYVITFIGNYNQSSENSEINNMLNNYE